MLRTTHNRYAIAAAAVAFGAAAMPATADSFTQWAPVVRATPVYSHLSDPQQQCWTEQVTTNEYVDAHGVPLGAVAGGITGGVIGNQVGNGYGRDAATVSGGVTAPAIGNAIDRERAGIEVAPVRRDIERCRVVDTGKDALEGYDVTYRLGHHEFTSRMPYDPGSQ